MREAFSDISVLARFTSCFSSVLDSCVSSFSSWPMDRSSLRSPGTAMAYTPSGVSLSVVPALAPPKSVLRSGV